jgi:very-short-patch-repair endonuclease
MRKESAHPDAIVAQIAGRRHGVVTFEQLLRAGLTPAGITRRVQAGRLHRVHRGVYAVGTPVLTQEGRWLAAVLACGPEAVLSHASAAKLWSISPRCPQWADVTIPGHNGRRRRKGIALHRSTTLGPNDTTIRRGIPVTTHARTLRDCGYGPEPTRSDLERAFVKLCRRHRLPKPEFNAKVGPHKVDVLWRAEGLIIEIDSWAYHRSRASFESDRARDRELTLRGFRVLRFVDREVMGRPAAVGAALRAHLGTGTAR